MARTAGIPAHYRRMFRGGDGRSLLLGGGGGGRFAFAGRTAVAVASLAAVSALASVAALLAWRIFLGGRGFTGSLGFLVRPRFVSTRCGIGLAARVFGIAATPFGIFAPFALVEAVQVLLLHEVDRAFGCCSVAFFQTDRLFAPLVEGGYFMGAGCGDGDEIGGQAAVGAVGDEAGQNVGFEQVVGGIGRFERKVAGRQAPAGFDVGIHLIVETALELGALSCQFLRVGRYVLQAGRGGGHGVEVFHPGGAAQFTSAGADTADASGFLAGTDLFHLDADAEGFGQHLDELTEVDAGIGNVIKDGFVAVALIFHVADFHIQIEFLGYLAGTYHGVLFQRFGFLVLLDVSGACLAVDALDFCAGFEAGLAHLQRHELAREGNHADVVTGRGFNGHDVSLDQGQVVFVAEITFAGVLELHLDKFAGLGIAGDVCQIVVGVELPVLAAAALRTEAAQAGSYLEFVFHIWDEFGPVGAETLRRGYGEGRAGGAAGIVREAEVSAGAGQSFSGQSRRRPCAD